MLLTLYVLFAWCMVRSTARRAGSDRMYAIDVAARTMQVENYTVQIGNQTNRSEVGFPDLPESTCPEHLDVTDYYKFDKKHDKLGQGNFGAVYKARDDDGAAVAIKDIFDWREFQPAEIAPSRLNLAFNSEILEVFQPHKKHVQMVYTLYSGGSFHDYMRHKTFDVKGALSFASQIAYGLWRLHLQGFVHRDLKPDNIMKHGGKLIICDYGLVGSGCSASNPNCCRGDVGSPLWFSPAQFLGNVAYGPQADWHAFALIIYQMLVGRNKFPAANPGLPEWDMDYLRANVLKRSPDLSKVPEEPLLKDLLTRLLSKSIDSISPASWYTRNVAEHPVLSHEIWTSVGQGKGKELPAFWRGVCLTHHPDQERLGNNCDAAHVPTSTPLCKHAEIEEESVVDTVEKQKERLIDDNCAGIEKLFGFAEEVGNWVYSSGFTAERSGSKGSEAQKQWVKSRQIGFQGKDLAFIEEPTVDDVCSVIATMYKTVHSGTGFYLEIKSEDFEMQCRSNGGTLGCGAVRDADAGVTGPMPYVYKTTHGLLARGKKKYARSKGIERRNSFSEYDADMNRQIAVVLSPVDGAHHKKIQVLRVSELGDGGGDDADKKYGSFEANFVLQKVHPADMPTVLERAGTARDLRRTASMKIDNF